MNKYFKKALMPIFKAMAEPGIMNPHTPYEVKLMLAGVKPVAIIEAGDINAKLQSAIADGRIIEIGREEFEDLTAVVIAQRDKVEEGREVFARYYRNNEGYPKIVDGHARIGSLLGYTQKDIEKKDYTMLDKLTDPIRTFARKECMLCTTQCPN